MSLFADHSFAFFNLWLLMLLYAFPILVTVVHRRGVFRPTSSRFASSRSRREYLFFVISKMIMLVYFLYSVVLPLRLDTVFALIGIVVYLFGYAFYLAAWITIAISGGAGVITGGPYRVSRHPVYLSSAFCFIGAGVVSGSIVFLGLSVLVGASHLRNAPAEEEICLEVYGNEYRRYAAATPRWFGLPAPAQNKHR